MKLIPSEAEEGFLRLSTHSGEVPASVCLFCLAKEGFVGFHSQLAFGFKCISWRRFDSIVLRALNVQSMIGLVVL